MRAVPCPRSPIGQVTMLAGALLTLAACGRIGYDEIVSEDPVGGLDDANAAFDDGSVGGMPTGGVAGAPMTGGFAASTDANPVPLPDAMSRPLPTDGGMPSPSDTMIVPPVVDTRPPAPDTRPLYADWWDQNWKRRRKLVFDNRAQNTNLGAFTVLVVLNNQRIAFGAARANGQDLRFVDADGQTVLAHEIESWNDNGVSHVWVNVPRVDSASNQDFIWLYYANPGAGPLPATGTWNLSYRGVWHLHNDERDASGRGNHGQNAGTTNAAGRIAGGHNFDGTGAHINMGSAASLDRLFAGGGTIEGWIRPTGYGQNNYGRVFDKSSTVNSGDGWALQVNGSPTSPNPRSIRFERGFTPMAGGWETPTNTLLLNTTYYVAVTYDEDSPMNDPIIYLNGVAQTVVETRTPSGIAQPDGALPLWTGDFPATGMRGFSGMMDELRVARGVRPADWIAAQHLSTTDAFVSYQIEQILP